MFHPLRLLPCLALLLVGTDAAYSSFRMKAVDATTGASIFSGLRCALYDESNSVVSSSSSSGDGCTLAPSNSGGGYQIATIFSIRIEKDGYYPVRLSGLALALAVGGGGFGQKVSHVRLSEKLLLTAVTKEFRVVLSWGAAHSDLDSHLLVPPTVPGSSTWCDVSWQQKKCRGVGTDAAELDVDDTSYYGPETTTMKNPHPGVYAYLVHIYTGSGGSSSTCWDTSGINAKVEVWSGEKGGLLKALSQPLENPPSTCPGHVAPPTTCHQYWHVFNLDATTNTYTFVNQLVPSIAAARQSALTGSGAAAALADTRACSCLLYGGMSGLTVSAWAQFATSAAANLHAAMLADSGVAGDAMCHAALQGTFSGANVDAQAEQAAALAASLATKVQARFDFRYEQARALRGVALGLYNGTLPRPAAAATQQPRCVMPCPEACVYDASFHTKVNRRGFGLRYGARAAAAGSLARATDEAVVTGVGEAIVGPGGTFESDPTTKWAYFGTEHGVNVMTPQTQGDRATCRAYDPRLRPWYAEAVTRLAKNVVVVLDGSGGVTEATLLTLKAGAHAVLGTLAAGDTANVVVGRNAGTAPSVPGDTAGTDLTYRSCQKDQMLRTVPVNKRLLSRFVDEVRPTAAGAAAPWDATAALTKAQALLRAQRRHAALSYPSVASTDVIVMLSAGEAGDATPAAQYSALKAALAPAAHWALHSLSSPASPSTLGGACDDYQKGLATADAGFTPARYYAHPNLNKNPGLGSSADTFASAFYMDNSGLGLVSTIVSPVHHPAATLRGVVGVDVTVLELVADLVFDREFTSSYAFIVDAAGTAVWHPALPSPGDASDASVEPTHIADLEVSAGFAAHVLPGLLSGGTGAKALTIAMPTARGDATFAGFGKVTRPVTFAWRPIVGSALRICVVLTPEDGTAKALRSPPLGGRCTAGAGPTAPPQWGASAAAGEGEVAGDKCDVYHDLNLGQTCGRAQTTRPGTSGKVVAGAPAVFFAASAFDVPGAWLEHQETAKDAAAISGAHTCPGHVRHIFTKAVRGLKDAAVNDNLLARRADACWARKQAGNPKVVWTYFGSASGLFRNIPATLIKKRYEAAKRPWYMASVANKDAATGKFGVTVSTPYLDASGAGEVITVSRAITRGGTGASDPVAGVLGIDFKLDEVQRLVNTQAHCGHASSVCMLLDETAHLVFHDDFVPTAAAEENTFLATKHREAARALIASGVLKQNTCMDYAAGMRKTSYKVDLAAGAAASGGLGCGHYALSRLGDSNTFLLALSSNGCVSGTKAKTPCEPCTAANCAAATWASLGPKLLCQPCKCRVEYDGCALNYGQSSPKHDACPASPPPLFTDLCPTLVQETPGSGLDGASTAALVVGLVAAGLITTAGVTWRCKHRRGADGGGSRASRGAPRQPAAATAPPMPAIAMAQVVHPNKYQMPMAVAVVPTSATMSSQSGMVAAPPQYTM